jgi:hypothetical protein
MNAHVASFVAERWSIDPDRLRIRLQPLGGGLESRVALVTVEEATRAPVAPARMIVKQLPARAGRHAGIYEFLARVDSMCSAEVFGVRTVDGTRYVYLEEVQPCSSWPWNDTSTAVAVCGALAQLHERGDLPLDGFTWDYDSELASSAAETLAVARHAVDHRGVRYWQRLGDLARVVDALPLLRSRLLSLGTAVIHGDVHPGNVMLRATSPHPAVALIDWDRARVGSPLEDVASWLHSLGCWEPEARRRHDTLLRAYIAGRAEPWLLDRELRTFYWFASVSNGLAGAIRYHLAVLADRSTTHVARAHSTVALPAWQRVVRRAAARLNTSRARCR